ncbi:L10-interacting MYB domain-containing protein-like [Ananas comosus]|uniref:L10-interacting MYB domain-containing protein-like n=1 Tax=Ananas comosus TaxID=4615 RepID=A0A6P5EED2_ANACO|nr:L10-interacting MYB domain-containing protein-like [Ananas comosus]
MDNEIRSNISSKKISAFKWNSIMSRFFIQFMAEQARQGMKIDKSFKPQTLNAAVVAVNEQFGCKITESNVRNHLRTLRARWLQIKQLKEKSGVGWDEKEKKIIMGEDEYKTYIQANPKDEPYINKPINDYEELALICGNDQATGKYTKQTDQALGVNLDGPSFINIDTTNEGDTGLDDIIFTESSQLPSTPKETTSNSSKGKNKRIGEKRLRDSETEVIRELATQVGQVATALKGTRSLQFSNELFQEVMKLPFSVEQLEDAYDFLMENDVQARCFMAKPLEMRMKWMQRFRRTRFYSDEDEPNP